MKFVSIKTGDKVMARKSFAGLGYSNSSSFWVAVLVEKVTPKQFKLKGFSKPFRKEDGSQVGDVYADKAQHIGDVVNEYPLALRHVRRVSYIRNIQSYIGDFAWKKVNELDYEKAASLDAELFYILSKHGLLKEADK